jgi:hypothetical protein
VNGFEKIGSGYEKKNNTKKRSKYGDPFNPQNDGAKMYNQFDDPNDKDKQEDDFQSFYDRNSVPGTKRKPTKIKPAHEKDFDPSTATEEELASMFNLRDQQSYDPRSMEEIQEEQRQREYARKMAKQAVDAGIIKPKMKEQ